MIYLYPTLKGVLACPSRYYREKIRREAVPAPFAASVLGQRVHARIAESLQTGEPARTPPFSLPKRLVLREGDTLGALTHRAQESLAFFNRKCRPWLARHTLLHTEYTIRHTLPSLTVSGKLDAILRTRQGEHIVDWKTGSLASTEQLRFYLALRHLETGREDLRAEAVSLSTGASSTVAWSPDTQSWFHEGVAAMLKALEEAQAHPERLSPGPHCGYCPYAHDCEGSEAGARYLLDTETGEVRRLEMLHG